MTLFEVLLVLALLAVAVGLSTPLLQGSFSSIRLRRGTDQVLATWSKARTHAIESGEIFQFRFEPEGGSYRAEPWDNGLAADSRTDSLSAESSQNDPLATPSGDELSESSRAELQVARWQYEAELPAEIVFSTGESVAKDEVGQLQTTRLDQNATTLWSAPILFYPDGTTSSASVLLTGGQGLYRRATLRSLTGIGRASDLLTREAVDRARTR